MLEFKNSKRDNIILLNLMHIYSKLINYLIEKCFRLICMKYYLDYPNLLVIL